MCVNSMGHLRKQQIFNSNFSFSAMSIKGIALHIKVELQVIRLFSVGIKESEEIK